MAVSVGNVSVTVGTTGVVPFCESLRGSRSVAFWNTSATGTLYVGTGTAITTTNSLQCHSIPTPFSTYMGSQPAILYGTAATATCSFNYIISTTA